MKIFGRLSVRNKMIVGILTGFRIPYFLGSIYIQQKAEEWLFRNYVENTSLVLMQSAEYIDESVLHQMKAMISVLVYDDRIIDYGSELRSYTDFDPSKDVQDSSEKEKQITATFQSIVEEENVLSFISYGNEDGGYVEYPAFHPSGPYDPRTRAWYINAINQEDFSCIKRYAGQFC